MPVSLPKEAIDWLSNMDPEKPKRNPFLQGDNFFLSNLLTWMILVTVELVNVTFSSFACGHTLEVLDVLPK